MAFLLSKYRLSQGGETDENDNFLQEGLLRPDSESARSISPLRVSNKIRAGENLRKNPILEEAIFFPGAKPCLLLSNVQLKLNILVTQAL